VFYFLYLLFSWNKPHSNSGPHWVLFSSNHKRVVTENWWQQWDIKISKKFLRIENLKSVLTQFYDCGICNIRDLKATVGIPYSRWGKFSIRNLIAITNFQKTLLTEVIINFVKQESSRTEYVSQNPRKAERYRSRYSKSYRTFWKRNYSSYGEKKITKPKRKSFTQPLQTGRVKTRKIKFCSVATNRTN
jgi:hypothetical protein